MADSRINLLSSASSTASDDFFVVDGNTNGTRKLNAFSPTIGGNLAVTGTLTVNSTSSFVGNATLQGSALWLNDGGGGTFNFVNGSTVANTLRLGIGNTNQVLITDTKTTILATTASTTTSTGALVVSGGVGVGNEVSVYGRVRAQLGLHADGNVPAGLAAAYQVDVQAGTSRDILSFGDSSRAGLIRGEQDGSNRVTWRFGRYTASTFAEYLRITGVAATDALVNFYGTTNSTTTSTGALVVGGGVGVGGAINAGGDIATAGTMRSVGFHVPGNGAGRPANTDSYLASTATTQIPLYVSGYTGGGQSADILRVSLNSTSDWFSVKGNGQVSCFATTASTSTSSGALVVSGGVGVAGAIYAGGALFTVSGAGFNTPDWRFYQSGTSGYVRDLVNGQMALQFVSGNASTIQVYATGTQDSTSTTSGALVSSGGLGVAGAVNAGTFYGLVDGVTAPATAGGYARIYVDSADGDLKVKFGDGTVKTIATDS